MKITALIENVPGKKTQFSEHGLSLYIETDKRKILFDFGASVNYIENAKQLGIDLNKVELAFLSHGHYDHGGGLEAFLEINKKAKIYVSKYAFGNYYARRAEEDYEYIGLDQKLHSETRIVYLSESSLIEEGLDALLNVPGDSHKPASNKNLLEKQGNNYVEDRFRHEQNLVLFENEKKVLITGCAHNGIENIIESFHHHYHSYPDVIVGGFHLYKYCLSPGEESPDVKEIGKYFLKTKSQYYTCHCTGVESFSCLKEIMGNQIEYIETGRTIEV